MTHSIFDLATKKKKLKGQNIFDCLPMKQQTAVQMYSWCISSLSGEGQMQPDQRKSSL